MLFIFSMPGLIRHLWQLMAIVFLLNQPSITELFHRCLWFNVFLIKVHQRHIDNIDTCCIPKCKNQVRRKKKEENEKNEHNSEGKLIYKFKQLWSH